MLSELKQGITSLIKMGLDHGFIMSKKDEESAPSDSSKGCAIKDTIFSSLVPSLFINHTVISNTIDFLKYRKLYYIYEEQGKNYGSYIYNYISREEYLDMAMGYLKKAKYITNLKFNEKTKEKDKYDWNENYFVSFNIKDFFVKMWDYNNGRIGFRVYHSRMLNFEHRVTRVFLYIEKVIKKISGDLRKKYVEKFKIKTLMPSSFDPTLNRMKNFCKVYQEMPHLNLRWVILVAGKPGTGKTWLFDQISNLFDNPELEWCSELNNSMSNIFEDYSNKAKGRKTEEQPALIRVPVDEAAHTKFNMASGVYMPNCNRGLVNVPFQVLDEVDRYIGNYADDVYGINTFRSLMVNRFKEQLEEQSGIIVLITNHLNKLDQSAIRDGRVNEVILLESNYYTLEEKYKILEYYNEQYQTKNFTIPNEELKDMTIAKIESTVKKYLLDQGLDKLRNLNGDLYISRVEDFENSTDVENSDSSNI